MSPVTFESYTSQDLARVLEWYLEIGWDEPMAETVQDRMAAVLPVETVTAPMPKAAGAVRESLGTAEAMAAVGELLGDVETLEALKAAISSFDGLAIKKTASHMVFADGFGGARLMIVGEAPDADDDRLGVPFSGEAGQLLDKMVGAIGLSRTSSDPATSVYLTQTLNWRPPGNRTPTAAEIELSAPFLEKHIELVKPAFLLLMGSVPVRALLARSESMTKLRGQWLDYRGIPCLVTFPPSFLLKSPAKKREAWADLQDLQKRLFDPA